MSTITHSLLAGILAILLYLHSNNMQSEKKFRKSHVIIFTINGFIGPDIGKLGMILSPVVSPLNYFLHTIISWIIISFPISLLYYFIFNKIAKDKESNMIQFKNVLKLVIGAGIFHFAVDLLDGGVRLYPNYFGLPDIVLNLDLFKTGELFVSGPLTYLYPDFGLSELFIISIIFLIIIIWSFYNKSTKSTIIISIIYVSAFIILLIIFGSNIVHEENDLGMLIYGSLFWMLPIGLCLWSYEEKQEN